VLELENKVRAEKQSLEERIKNMEKELPRLRDLTTLRTECEEKRVKLTEEQSKLDRTYKACSATLKEIQNRHESLKVQPFIMAVVSTYCIRCLVLIFFYFLQKQLANNETYAQLSNLERKLSLLGQNNFAMKEYIESRKSASNCEQIKKQACDSVAQYNAALKSSLKAGHVLVM